ncbi:cupredoxin domain-containing protein [Salinibacter grassmerensis]|uniref:cupredoxin domain-containing protein n=1 Tax=Salinibacter grassmerensis TaxID=3040353 RepID=UPI0021E8882D|nr:hypothetical protein [Salinibacter grassmerensis]
MTLASTIRSIRLRRALLAAALLVLPFTLILSGCDSGGSGMDESSSVGDQITYDLTAQTDAGVSGTVTFWRAGPESSLVTLNLDGSTTLPGKSHPAHIHESDGGNIAYYLSAVNGSSPNGTTARKIGVPIDSLAAFDGYVNIHESPANLGNVVAQGDIGANAQGTDGSGLDFVANPDSRTYTLNPNTTEGSVLSNGDATTVRFEELTSSKTLVTYSLDIDGSVNQNVESNVTVAQIGHIHQGSLANAPGSISNSDSDGFSGYLGSVAPTDPDARSSRIINASFDKLTSYNGYVNIHQSIANSQYKFAQGDIGSNAENGGGSSADVTVTINNEGSSAWVVDNVEGASGVAGSGQNPTLTLKVGTRYRFDNNGGSNHPLGLQNSSGEYLLNQTDSGSGSLEGDSGINYEEDSDGVAFTYTQSLADAVKTYRCTVHSSMEGTVQTDGSGGGDDGGGYP